MGATLAIILLLASGAVPTAADRQVLAEINVLRPPDSQLTWSDSLYDTAQAKSGELERSDGKCAIDSCDGTGWITRVSRLYGPYDQLAQLAGPMVGTARGLVAGWQARSAHVAILNDPRLRDAACAIGPSSAEGSWVVCHLARR